MILYELRCAADHTFEGWFKDGQTYDRQAAAKAVVCPVCGDSDVAKAPMAPRLSKGAAASDEAAQRAAAIREALLELRGKVESSADYVGDKFTEEARRIHYGETAERSIYGEATDDDTRELIEEGIKVGRIPWIPRSDS